MTSLDKVMRASVSAGRRRTERCEKNGASRSTGLAEVFILMLPVVAAVAIMLVASTCLDEVGEITCMLLAASSIMFNPLLAKVIAMKPSAAEMYENRILAAVGVALAVNTVVRWLAGQQFAIDQKARLSTQATADLEAAVGMRLIVVLLMLEALLMLFAVSRAEARAEG